MQVFTETVLNHEGQPMPGATVTLFESGTNNLAILYDEDETTTLTNPLTADANGFAICYLANGRYDYAIERGGVVIRINRFTAFDPADGGGGVTSVGLTVPDFLQVAGSPITDAGTLAVTAANASGRKFIASPVDGSSGAYAGRGIDVADLPQLVASLFPSATITKVATAVKTDAFTFTGTTAWTNITGASVTIAPASNTDKIILLAAVTAQSNATGFLKWSRGGVDVSVGDAASNRNRVGAYSTFNTSSGDHPNSFCLFGVDSPATTSSTTYQLQMKLEASGNTGCVNRSLTDSDSATVGGRAALPMIALSVKA